MAERKQHRIRFDAICNAITRGDYDDRLPEIKQAIDDRLDKKRDDVLNMVREVYGPNFIVVRKGAETMATSGIISTSASGEGVFVQNDMSQGADDALQTEEPTEAPLGDFESRSPLIGPFNPS